MKSKLRMLGVLICVLCLTSVFVTGCAKKQVLPDDAGKQAGVEAAKTGPSAEELAAREKALKEQAERDRLAREQAAAAAAMAAEEAAAKDSAALENIYFDFDQFSLTKEAREILQKHGAWLSAHPGYTLVIEGHCDDRGTTEYNLALGERRAAETMKFLVALGVDKSRMKTISYGEEKPLDPAETEEAWAKNRRAQFVVNPKK